MIDRLNRLIRKCRILARRPDFRRHPARALYRRLFWRLRWQFNQQPFRVPLPGGARLFVPRHGPGALIYFQQFSEPEITAFLRAFLRPGMTYFDIGAHLGEHVLEAAKCVGPSGEVHAFEPAPKIHAYLARNIEANALRNVKLNRLAMSDSDGVIHFQERDDPALSSVQLHSDASTIQVDCMRVDHYWRESAKPIDLIKVDVEGAEESVVKGTTGLLRRPVWIFEYSPANSTRLGTGAAGVIPTFRAAGYDIWTWDGAVCSLVDRSVGIIPVSNDLADTMNLIAAEIGRHPLESAVPRPV